MTDREYKFKIYEKGNGYNKYEIIIWGYLFFSLGSMVLLNYIENQYFVEILWVVYAIFSLYMLVMKITSYFRYEYLLGKFNGHIVFKENVICINGREILIDEIEKIEFFCGDYVGMTTSSNNGIDGILSQGVNNSVYIVKKNGEREKVNFQIMREGQMRKTEKVLIYYCQRKILHRLNFMSVLGLGYDQIQEYKKKYDI